MDLLKNKQFSVVVHHTPDDAHALHTYLAAAHAMAQAGRNLLILTPEIARAEWLTARLQATLPRPVIGLHSRLTPSGRARQWLALQAAEAPQIVVGSRSALFAPVAAQGLIIVDEEADPLYKQEERPRLHARDVAILRAQQARIPILLAGRFISVESYWHGQTGKYDWLDGTMAPAPGNTTRLIDLRSEPLLEGLLTKPLIEAIDERLAHREQTLLFVNRRGYASGLICRECGELLRCPTCQSALSVYSASNGREALLRCRYCALRMTAPTLCPGCRGTRLGPLGTGTQRVEEALRRQWPQARLARIDRDAPAGQEAQAELLIGTQLCLHRPPPPRLSLVAVLDAELDLSRPDFRAEERAMQLLVRLQGLLRPGPGSTTLLLQSRQPGRPPLQALAAGSPALFYKAELRQRQELGYPPFSRLAVVRVEGPVERLAKQARRVTAASTATRVELWGPVPLADGRGRQPRWELLLKAPTAPALQRAVGSIRTLPLASQLERQGRLQIEIDPV
jgi:primosomal protein N' (replication factor Y)